MNKPVNLAVFFSAVLLSSASIMAQTAGTAATTNTSSSAEVLTNDTIIKLVSVGLGDEAVIAKIRSAKGNYDLSTDGLIALKSKGVSSAVIAAMITPVATQSTVELSMDSADPKAPHFPGVYVLNAIGADGKMTRINPTSSSQARTSGLLGYAFTAGLAPMDLQASIAGPNARISAKGPRPVFYFYFDESVPRHLQGSGNSLWSSGSGGVTSAPTELNLVSFKVKKDKREARFGTVNIGGAKTGVMDKDRIEFSSEQISAGIFKVTPSSDLAPGEYGFVQTTSGSGTLANSGAAAARVFDFSISK